MRLGTRQGSRVSWLVLLGILASINVAARVYNARNESKPAFGSNPKILRVQLKDYRQDMQWILDSGYAVAGIDYPNQIVDLLVDEVSIKSAKGSLKPSMTVVEEKDIPKAAPDAAYHTSAEVAEEIQTIAEKYPNITALKSIGKSGENRDIWAIKITSNPQIEDPSKPAILFNSMHHAREVMTTEVAMDTINYLTFNYGMDAKVTHWIDQNEIWVLPMFNVDGNNKVWTQNNMWRKNARGGYGVDINRNYPYKWNGCRGSSGSQYADDYRGPSAASEPETQAMMNFVSEIRPVFSISYHSYSELVLYPFGCSGQSTPSAEVVEDIGKELARKIPRDSGSGTYSAGTPWEILYPVDGGDIDWMYDTYKVVPYVIELNSSRLGFQPSYSPNRDQTVTKLRNAWGYLIDQLDASSVRGVVRDRNGAIVSKGRVTIEAIDASQKTKSPIMETRAINPDGSFHFVVLPGEYRVKVESLGRTTFESEVGVGQDRVNLNIDL